MSLVNWLYRLPPQETVLWGALPQALAVVARTGVAVPPAFVISRSATQQLLRDSDLVKAANKALKDASPKRAQYLAYSAKELRQAIQKMSFPKELQTELRYYLEQLEAHLLADKKQGLRLTLLPVGNERNFQYHTITVKKLDDLLRGLAEMWSLGISAQQLGQQLKDHQEVLPEVTPVLISAHPLAAASGIGQVYDPEAHDTHTIHLTAYFHEHVIDQAAHPDIYRYDRSTLLPLSRTTGRHRFAVQRDGKHTHPRQGHSHPVLSEERQVFLARLIKRAQTGFELPMRFHWVEIQGQFLITEAYPLAEGVRASATQPTPVGAANSPIPLAFGQSLNPGVVVGIARIINRAKDWQKLQKGEIAVVSHLSPEDRVKLTLVAGFVTEVGGLHGPEAATALSIGLPAVGSVAQATNLVKDGQQITLDAVNGIIYEGKVSIQPFAEPVYRSATPVTATRISVAVPDPLHIDADLLQGSNGIGLLRGEFLLDLAGVHPQHILEQNKQAEYIDILTEVVEQAARLSFPDVVRYQLHDLHSLSASARALRPHRHEPNPLLGYRGAHRLLKEPELVELELKVLGGLRERGLTNLEVVLPMVRTVPEAEAIVNLVKVLWPDEELPRLWVRCETPALTIAAAELGSLPIHGVYVDVATLAQLMSGLDGGNYQVAHHLDQADQSVLDAVHYAVASFRAKGVQAALVAEQDELRTEVIATAVSAGVTEVVVSPAEVDEVRLLLGSVEQRLVIDHVLAEGSSAHP